MKSEYAIDSVEIISEIYREIRNKFGKVYNNADKRNANCSWLVPLIISNKRLSSDTTKTKKQLFFIQKLIEKKYVRIPKYSFDDPLILPIALPVPFVEKMEETLNGSNPGDVYPWPPDKTVATVIGKVEYSSTLLIRKPRALAKVLRLEDPINFLWPHKNNILPINKYEKDYERKGMRRIIRVVLKNGTNKEILHINIYRILEGSWFSNKSGKYAIRVQALQPQSDKESYNPVKLCIVDEIMEAKSDQVGQSILLSLSDICSTNPLQDMMLGHYWEQIVFIATHLFNKTTRTSAHNNENIGHCEHEAYPILFSETYMPHPDIFMTMYPQTSHEESKLRWTIQYSK